MINIYVQLINKYINNRIKQTEKRKRKMKTIEQNTIENRKERSTSKSNIIFVRRIVVNKLSNQKRLERFDLNSKIAFDQSATKKRTFCLSGKHG